MKIRVSVIALILFSLLPHGVSWYQQVNDGGLAWPMVWSNERTFWGLVFAGFSALAVSLAFKHRSRHPKLLVASWLLTAVAITPTLYDVARIGLGPSSKGDAERLEILGYWVSDWWR